MALGSFPDFTGAFTGTDTSTGKRNVDLYKAAFKASAPNFSSYLAQAPVSSSTQTPVPSPTYDNKNPIDNILNTVQAIQTFEEARYPFELQKFRQMSDIAAQQQLKQAYDLYPLLSQAGRETTERNLGASEAFLRTKEQMPSNVQNIMASKQAQATSAAAGEAERARAVAAQQDAAKNYAGRFAGQYIQVG
jgi:hypothetical protein